jgi:DNA-binding MarR family transcriptional regulator
MEVMSIDWKKASKFSVPEESAGFLVWQITRMWQEQVTEALIEIELTHIQFVVLAGVGWLTKDKLLVTQAQLAEFYEVDVMSISQVSRKLEDKQLIQRREHPSDTRAKVLSLTDSGETVLKLALEIVGKLDEKFFGFCNQQVLASELKKLFLAVKECRNLKTSSQ